MGNFPPKAGQKKGPIATGGEPSCEQNGVKRSFKRVAGWFPLLRGFLGRSRRGPIIPFMCSKTGAPLLWDGGGNFKGPAFSPPPANGTKLDFVDGLPNGAMVRGVVFVGPG